MRFGYTLFGLLGLVFTVICLAVIGTASSFVLSSYESIEEAEIQHAGTRVQERIREIQKDLASKVSLFMESPEFKTENAYLDERLGADIGIFLTQDGKIQKVLAAKHSELSNESATQNLNSLKYIQDSECHSGTGWWDNKPVIYHVHSSGPNTFLAVSKIKKSFFFLLKDQLKLDAHFNQHETLPLNELARKPDSVSLTIPMYGMGSSQTGSITLTMERLSYLRGLEVVQTLQWVLTGTSAIVIGIVALVCRRKVIHPLQQLTRYVNHLGNNKAPSELLMARKDELGILARAIMDLNDRLVENAEEVVRQNKVLEKANHEIKRVNEVLQTSLDGIAVINSQGVVLKANASCAKLFSCESLVGKSFFELVNNCCDQPISDNFKALLDGERVQTFIHLDNARVTINAVLVPVIEENGEVNTINVFLRDVSEERRLASKLTHQSYHDALTGLPNRLFIERKLETLDPEQTHGLLFVDVDNFKSLNDTYGHAKVDLLLKEYGYRLQSCIDPGDYLARFGSDDFVVLLSNASEERLTKLAIRLLDAVSTPFRIEGREVTGSISIGGCLLDTNTTYDEALRNADTALHVCKAESKGHFMLYDKPMREKLVERVRIEEGLRFAIQREEFSLVYQPLIRIEDNTLYGAETLIRWKNEELGQVSPDKFIPVAESTGQIIQIGAWVLENACKQAAKWRRERNEEFVINVNLSQVQLQWPGLVNFIRNTLDMTGLPPHCLNLEITETLAVTEFERTLKVLNGIKALGCKLSVDDFGTGYSSLAYLQKLPIDCVKIDRSFVKMIGEDPAPQAIILAIITLCKEMNLRIAGEGVEKVEQLEWLRQVGCNLAQGYLFAKPLDSGEFEEKFLSGVIPMAA